MPGGRPTTYSQDIIERAMHYLAHYKDEYGDEIPSVEGLSEVIERSRSTIYRWADDEEKQEFRDILELINAKQKKVLLNNGLNGTFNSNIAKLALGKHGLHDTKELQGNAEKPLRVIAQEMTPEEATQIYRELIEDGL